MLASTTVNLPALSRAPGAAVVPPGAGSAVTPGVSSSAPIDSTTG
jgi:hypothetical protein